MVDAPVHVIDRGCLERDLDYVMEGHTLGTHDEFESLRRIEEIQRRHDAEVVYGHDPEQFEAIREGWGA